jgi:hypothetical protein
MSFRSLRRYVVPEARPASCELCGAPLGESHRHVVERARRGVSCACWACAVLFTDGDRFRTVPERVLADATFDPAPEAWAALGVPVRLSFLVRHDGAWTASYPSPAGPVEAPLDEAAAAALVAMTPLAALALDDVEALLLRRPRDCLLVPVDACYELAGKIRRTWRGFTGGADAERAIDELCAELRARVRR